jgi:hypothetical protein
MSGQIVKKQAFRREIQKEERYERGKNECSGGSEISENGRDYSESEIETAC